MKIKPKYVIPYLAYNPTALLVTRPTFTNYPNSEQIVNIGVNNVDSLYSKRYRQVSCKLILKSLSDLAEGDEESEYMSIYGENDDALWEIVNNLPLSVESIHNYPYYTIQFLIERHYDVFGLLDNNLAVKK